MNKRSNVTPAGAETRSLVFGVLAVLAFSLSMPATRAAVVGLGGPLVGLGRALAAAVIAGALLLATQQPLPTRLQWRSVFVVGFGVVLGFPLLSAIALRSVSSVHGSVIAGLLPASTAICAAVRAREVLPQRFWVAVLIGFVSVVAFAVVQGAGALEPADGWLLLAVVLGGLGYAEGGRLARELGGWQVICWALVAFAPFLVVPVALEAQRVAPGVPASAWIAFGYLSLVSMLLGFFAWYHSLALGGIARASQLQLAQPALSTLWSALLLGEEIRPATVFASAGILVAAALCRSIRITPVERRTRPE